MNILPVIALLSAVGGPLGPDPEPLGLIAFELQIHECEGLDWRETIQSRLRFQGHRAGSSAWIADREEEGDASRGKIEVELATETIGPGKSFVRLVDGRGATVFAVPVVWVLVSDLEAIPAALVQKIGPNELMCKNSLSINCGDESFEVVDALLEGNAKKFEWEHIKDKGLVNFTVGLAERRPLERLELKLVVGTDADRRVLSVPWSIFRVPASGEAGR